MAIRKYFITIPVISFVVVILDQITKLLVVNRIQQGEVLQIIPNFLNLVLTYNKGIAFGLMSNLPDVWRQIAINGSTLLAVVVIVYFLCRHYKNDSIAHFAIAMILGGAIGNVIDRFFYGQVVDFIDAYYSTWHWPAFNIADSAVCMGVFILLFRPTQEE